MQRNEMAVAVAKDVIAQLKAPDNRLKVLSGHSYMSTKFSPDSLEGDLKDVIPQMLDAGCTVCARGAALLSKARLFDAVPLERVYSPRRTMLVFQQDTTNLLAGVFSQETLDKIEVAFEMDDIRMRIYYPRKVLRGCVEFGMKYDDDKDRLIAIMENIVENDGEFVI